MDKSFIKNLSIIKIKNFLKKNILLLFIEKKSYDSFENFIKILISKNYGRSKIIFGIFNWNPFCANFYLFNSGLIKRIYSRSFPTNIVSRIK